METLARTTAPAITSVPFLDLRGVNGPVKDEILHDIGALIDANAFVNGRPVEAFEAAFAAYCGTRFCVGMSSGLDALRLGLLARGIGAGDEVVVPAMTFAATLEAVLQVGATPVLADVRDDDCGLDPAAARRARTLATKAVLPVHLYGQMADVRALAGDGLLLLEDACQAHGATRDGVRAGAAGDIAAFSFYPGKNLGAMGDAGALVTDDPDVAASARALREHGQTRKYVHRWDGYTARLDALQAAVLLRKLPHLDAGNASRRRAAGLYAELLDGIGDLRLPQTVAGATHVWHLYTVRTADPEALAAFLGERGVGTGRHYPVPMHLCESFAALGHGPGDFPVAEAIGAETLSLPIFPGISPEQVAFVADAVAAYFRRG
jgi:dTDP-4-amino-4,6-dideoxygalactose transaminase